MKFRLFTLSLLVVHYTAISQSGALPLPHRTEDTVVVVGRKGVTNAGFKKELSGRELEEARGLSLAEALSRVNGVTILQTGSTIAKPVIHGLHSNRILTINNGVRQEGQQWGNEHAPEIDPFIADKLIVIKGVDELRYGSDAIGGVILVQPKPLQNKPGYATEINTAYFTNNRQFVISGVFEQQLKRWPAFAWRVQGTYKRGANAATPGYRLNNTGSKEGNFSVTAGYHKKDLRTEFFYSHFTTRLGIFIGSHIGNLSDLERAIAADKPNDVFLGQQTYSIGRPYQDVTHQLLKSNTQVSKNDHKFTLQLAAQLNNRKEFDIARSSSNTKPQLNLSISTFSEDLSWEHPVKGNFSGVVGIAAMQQDNAYAGRYFIPNYQSYTLGGYAIEKWARRVWEIQAGLRYDNKRIATNRLISGQSSFDHYDFDYSTLASSLNILFRPGTHWRINTAISISSRAPQVNELLSNGIHHGMATYDEGDINLQPERSVNVSAGISYHNPVHTVLFDVDVYTNHIQDFIYRQPKPDEPVLTIAGAFPKIKYQQTNTLLTGIDASLVVKPVKPVEWVNKVSLLRARDRVAHDWLILMPADRISTELLYHFKTTGRLTNTYCSAELQHVFEQTRVPTDKNGRQDYKPAPGAYTLIHFTAAATVPVCKLPVTWSIGVKNLFNTTYRDYLNSMRYFTDETGRNIYLRLKIARTHLYTIKQSKPGL